MAVGAVAAGGIEIVQQHELARQAALIGDHVFRVGVERGLAVPLAQIAEHLIVGAILLDDVDDVLDGRAVAGAQRDGQRLR